jgi:hypothetical protein
MTKITMLIPLLAPSTPQNKILQPINQIQSLSVTYDSMFSEDKGLPCEYLQRFVRKFS